MDESRENKLDKNGKVVEEHEVKRRTNPSNHGNHMDPPQQQVSPIQQIRFHVTFPKLFTEVYTILSLQQLRRNSHSNHFRLFAQNTGYANGASHLLALGLREASLGQSALKSRPFGGAANQADKR